ncbi:MAG: hypothetical protein H0T89_27000 [Deltaproteobacteria bacterium]|nr:hypothetical protein [Deltaproteobacteria bacterium]MDQ3301149.1 hypothetical protein [Myxococcota bacterium]
MIPYDDLVAALTSWRARQGLPVSAMPAASSGSGPARTAPPMAPPRGFSTNPPPLAKPDTHDDSMEVDDGALLEEAAYEAEGNDYAMNFAPPAQDGDEATAIGGMPERDSFGGGPTVDTEDVPGPPRGRNEDW